MAPTTTPHIAPITGGVELFRSCLVSTQYPGVEAATRWLFEQLDVEYVVNPDQTCCTGLGYYTDVVSFPTTVAVAARNACVAVEAGHPVQAYLCSTCYAINKKAHEALEDPEQRRRTNRVLGRVGRRYDDTVGRCRRSIATCWRSSGAGTPPSADWSGGGWRASRWRPTPPATTARCSPTRCSATARI